LAYKLIPCFPSATSSENVYLSCSILECRHVPTSETPHQPAQRGNLTSKNKRMHSGHSDKGRIQHCILLALQLKDKTAARAAVTIRALGEGEDLEDSQELQAREISRTRL